MLLATIFLLAYLLPLGARPLIIPDETRYAEIPREMLASGNWVVPRLDGLRYFEKPVLGYWANAVYIKLFGENTFAVRLPSALATLLTALMLLILARKFGTAGLSPFLPPLIFLSFFEVYAIGTFNVLDSLLSFFITGSLVSFFLAYDTLTKTYRKTGWLILCGIFCGLGFLTKGFVAVAVPVVAITPFLIWQQQWKTLFKAGWIPLTTAAVIVMPWAIMVNAREPDFWHFFIWNEHIRRFLADNAQHHEPLWYFLLLLPAAALPWTFLFPATVAGFRKVNLKAPLMRYTVCWFVFPFLFFSLSKGKLLTYTLPCFPPLSLLMAVGITQYFAASQTRAFDIAAKLLASVTIVAAIALAMLQLVGYNGFKLYSNGWQWLLVTIGLVAFAALLTVSFRAASHSKKVLIFAAAPILLLFISHFALPDITMALKAPGNFLLHHAHEITPNVKVVSEEEYMPAVCWYFKRDDVYLLNGAGESGYGLRYADARRRLLDTDGFRQLIQSHPGRVAAVLTEKDYQTMAPQLPQPLAVYRNIETPSIISRKACIVLVRY